MIKLNEPKPLVGKTKNDLKARSKMLIDLWNQGNRISDISQITGLHKTTVANYLHDAGVRKKGPARYAGNKAKKKA